ncbi:MAG: ribokinase [Calditrichaeota bacterium]|nr:MAG: ribokinase [Calditrichota bacterium]
MKITVVGSSNTDMIIRVPRIPLPGETILGGQFSMAAGGKGANQAVAAARAGGDVIFIARVGNDLFGNQALTGFEAEGIDISYVARDQNLPSGVAEIFVAENGENSIAVASGANANLRPADIQQAEAAIADVGVLVLQLESPLRTVEKAVEIAVKNGVPVILNPAPAQTLSEKLLNQISFITPNESEAQQLTGIPVVDAESAMRAANYLHKQGVENVIITMGATGAYVSSTEFKSLVPAFQVNSVDSTAAGDVFNGTLAVALLEGRGLLEAVRFASAAAALSVTRPGAQPSAPTRHEIMQLLAKT